MAEASLKQRIVGALVLLSLAVIFLPMLFTGGQEVLHRDKAGEIPEPPDKLKTIIYRLDDDGEFRELGKPPFPEAEVETVLEQAKLVETEVADVERTPAPKKTAQSAVTNSQTTPLTIPPGSWLVQIASFGRESNALELRDEIRGRGDSAFVDESSLKDKTIWRVRVGPYAEKNQANKTLARLEKETGLKGLVIYRE